MRIFIVLNILIVVLILLRRIMKGKVSCKAQYLSWIILPVFILMCCFVSIPVSIEMQRDVAGYRNEAVEQTAAAQVAAQPESAEPGVAGYDASGLEENGYQQTISHEENMAPSYVQAEAPARITIDYKTLAMAVWLIGSLVIGTGFLVINISFARKIRNERVLFSTYEHGNLKIYKIKGLDSPFLFWNRIYIPEELNPDSADYSLSLYHEYCHYRFGDCFWNVIRSLFVTVLWFDPLVWVVYFLVQHDSELAVDEKVIESIGDENRIRYGEMLLSYISRISGYNRLLPVSTSITGKSRKLMKTRIINIANKTSVKKYAAVIASVVLSAFCICLLVRPYFVYVDVNKPDLNIQKTCVETDGPIKIEPLSCPEPGKKSRIEYVTDNLRGIEEFKIPYEVRENTDINCSVLQVTSDYMYIAVRGVDYSNFVNIHRIYRYELVDGKQGRLTGSVDIDKDINGGMTCCADEWDIYEEDGKTYVMLDVVHGYWRQDTISVYEADFDNCRLTLDRIVSLDDIYVNIYKAGYDNGVIYVTGDKTKGGLWEIVYYKITEDGCTSVEINDYTSLEFSRIVYPVFKF